MAASACWWTKGLSLGVLLASVLGTPPVSCNTLQLRLCWWPWLLTFPTLCWLTDKHDKAVFLYVKSYMSLHSSTDHPDLFVCTLETLPVPKTVVARMCPADNSCTWHCAKELWQQRFCLFSSHSIPPTNAMTHNSFLQAFKIIAYNLYLILLWVWNLE